ncbi:bifunctional Zinc finger C2H2 superfamily/Zinc finger [Babesia duncani]|uniref:Bifunctional Zinc finger C2H2 superfamily/Zinc finger n=1 Tax=Babesia duncani TaxID=323732 RepID=A0AAD9UQU1_9APIC|nr:bifunctional Zinc finger C2H2 superfamily/Zinc finger [Babesia duncani]
MFKRAHLYTCTAPVPGKVQDEYEYYNLVENSLKSQKTSENTKGAKESSPNEEAKPSQSDDIKYMPGNKVAYCVYCKDKRLLNEDAIQKHLKSKNHWKKIKSAKTRQERDEKLRKTFNNRFNTE